MLLLALALMQRIWSNRLKIKLTPQVEAIGIAHYILSLWVLPFMLLLIHSFIHLTDNPLMVYVSNWSLYISPLIFLFIFTSSAYWAHRPIQTCLSDQTLDASALEKAMAYLPMRALKSFGLAGFIYVIYTLSVIFISSSFVGHSITPRMMVALVLSIVFGVGILIPTLAVALTMAWMVKARKKLSRQQLFIGDLEHLRNYPWFMHTSNRPWLIFGVTSLLPVSVLAIFLWIMLGTNDMHEQEFILMQATVLFFDLIVGGTALVWVTSRTIHRITRELSTGLNFLRQGKFDGHIAVMVDDDMGELARGINTALTGLKERESLKDSLAIASDIQKGLMPRDEPNVPNYAIAGFQQSCHAVGGDYYDYVQRQDGTTWLIIADVSGKGYPAALTVANLQAMLHALANGKHISLLDAATYINQSLHQSLQGGRFVTLFLAQLNPTNHELQWINAGHIPPLLRHKGHVSRLEASSPPLGMLDNLPLHVETTHLMPGDTFFACTDGITEARNAKSTMFGDKAVEIWFDQSHTLDPSLMPASMLTYLTKKGFHKRDDDITMLCLKRSIHE